MRGALGPFRYLVPLIAAVAVLAVPSVAYASSLTIEQAAYATWSTSFLCPDGSTGTGGRLTVGSSSFFEDGTSPNPNRPINVTFRGQCPDGTFVWGLGTANGTQLPTTDFDPDLEHVSVSGSYTSVRDNRGGLHTLTVNALLTANGPLVFDDFGPGGWIKQRLATATATVVFDGNTLVDGATTSSSFIRIEACEA